MEYINYAKEAISLYPILYQNIEFIRHNENMIFKISDKTNNKAFVLRIHKSKIQGLSGIQHTYEGLKSEMEFLHYLSSYKSLKIQNPIANIYGEYVTIHKNDEEEFSYYSTILEWIEGSLFTLKEDNSDKIVFRFGEKVADFHEASRLFIPQKDFIRPSYSLSSLETAGQDLIYGIEIGLFNSDQYKLMNKVIDKVVYKMKDLDERSDAWGVIHADYQLNNIVINNGEPSFIDFGLSGYGYYLFDLGSAASMLDSKSRDIFLQGYASKTSFHSEDITYIECLIFADIFISYMLFIHDENNRGWIKENVENISEACHKFLAGEEVFYTL